MARLIVRVLGAAAGGGYPQWNCACGVCRLVRDNDPRVEPSTQASLAVSADGVEWTLLNASPDLREQIAATPALHPRGVRDSPIAAVILTGAEIDQIAGLLHLRERHPFCIHASEDTFDILARNPIFDALDPTLVARRPIAFDTPFPLHGGIEAALFRVPGKVPLYLENGATTAADMDATVAGIELVGNRARVAFVPGAAAMTDDLLRRLAAADVVFFDGTLFTDDEMVRAGVGEKSGRRMGHMPIDGAGGSLAALAGLRNRRIYIHINNTNPMRVAGSPERNKVEAAGWEVAADGLDIVL